MQYRSIPGKAHEGLYLEKRTVKLIKADIFRGIGGESAENAHKDNAVACEDEGQIPLGTVIQQLSHWRDGVDLLQQERCGCGVNKSIGA